MRWIFFSLIAANLGIFIWWQTSKPQPQTPVHTYTTPAGVGPITLLSEANNTPPPASIPPANVPAAEAEHPETTAPEPTSQNDVAGVRDRPITPPAEMLPDVHSQCVLVGPYDNSELAQQALQKLHAKEINAHVYQMEISVSSGFQVYLDGFENRAQAKKRLDELQAGGIDSFIVPKGEFINTIALGSFDLESAAKSQLEKFAAKGIEAKLRESKRPLVEHWVALPPEAGDTLPESLRQALGVGKGDKKKEERQILCSTIASGKNIL